MKIKTFNALVYIVLILFFVVLINFLGFHNEQFVQSDSVNSNIIILNRIIESSNNKELNETKKIQPLTSFNL
jgi:hypothetical protein